MALSRTNAWLLTLVFGAVFVAAAWPMAQRIGRYNILRAFRHYHVEPLIEREIVLPGFPKATLIDDVGEDGRFAIRLTFGPEESPVVRLIPILRPPVLNISDLGIYNEWLRVLAINEVERDETGVQRPVKDSERIVVVVRRTPEGFDPNTWGSVRRTEWVFEFYELRRDGTIVESTRRWPMAKANYERAFQERAAAAIAADPTDDRLKRLADIRPIEERSIEYLAALHVIPKLNVPKYKFTDTAFGPHIMGWTLPVCMLSGLGFIYAFFFAVAPRRRFAPRDAVAG